MTSQAKQNKIIICDFEDSCRWLSGLKIGKFSLLLNRKNTNQDGNKNVVTSE